MDQKKTGLMSLLCLLALIILSCNPSKKTIDTFLPDNKTGESPKILFLNYILSRDSTKTIYEAQLISMIIREGTIKADRNQSSQSGRNDLEILVQDRNQQIISHHHIPNPLDRSVEYVNDDGQFERKMINLDSAQFSVRLQIEPGASFILLQRITDEEKEGTVLLKTTIN